MKPWSFEVQDIDGQRNNVSILNNVFDPARNQRTGFYDILEKRGRVSITVYTLAGDTVTSLLQADQSK